MKYNSNSKINNVNIVIFRESVFYIIPMFYSKTIYIFSSIANFRWKVSKILATVFHNTVVYSIFIKTYTFIYFFSEENIADMDIFKVVCYICKKYKKIEN